MGKVNDGIKTFNATLRTFIAAAVVAGAGFLGYQAYDLYNQPNLQLKQKQQELEKTLGELKQSQEELDAAQLAIDRLEASLHLLKVDQRVAELRILKQTTPENESDSVITTVEFVETDPEGKVIGEPRQFDVPGERVYLDYLVVKFDDKYVEGADLERGTAICLFQRLFGSEQKPEDGFQLDQPNTRPTAYARGERMSEFEKSIWTDFWDLAHDQQRLEAMGIRSAMADAPSVNARPGNTYRLEIRSTGGFQLKKVVE